MDSLLNDAPDTAFVFIIITARLSLRYILLYHTPHFFAINFYENSSDLWKEGVDEIHLWPLSLIKHA